MKISPFYAEGDKNIKPYSPLLPQQPQVYNFTSLLSKLGF